MKMMKEKSIKMKYLKSFNESAIGFKPSEADKIKFLPGFEFEYDLTYTVIQFRVRE